MNGRVVKRPQAVNDLDEQAAFLQRDSPDVAIRFLDQADATFERLADMPEMGKPYLSANPRLSEIRSFRVAGFANHLIYYRPIHGGVEVLRVLHGARDIASILQNELG